MPLKPESFRDSSFAAAVSPTLTRRSFVKAGGALLSRSVCREGSPPGPMRATWLGSRINSMPANSRRGSRSEPPHVE
jgi:hypothetical protein